MHVLYGITIALLTFPSLAISGEWQPSYQYATSQPQAQMRHIVSAQDIERAVREALILRGNEDAISVRVAAPNIGVVYRASTPVRVAIHALETNNTNHAWQAQAYMLSAQKTLSVIPVSGTFERMAHVPVLRSYIAEGDIITETDIEMREVPESSLRRGVAKSKAALIGQTPRRGISADRPIRVSEVTTPRMVSKGDSVTMLYTTPYMNIRGIGKALEHGTMGSVIRIRNLEGERDVVARVVGHNKVQLNMQADMHVAENTHR
jgi:flagella basal body P-ring formation protein FlgA